MKFGLVDRIVDLEPGSRIVTVKNLTMAEEYLAEHFPGFPVMPGVLMLEAITQSAAWLVRLTENFKHSLVLFGEAKQVKYGQFVMPGRQLRLEVEWAKEDGASVVVKAKGELDGQASVSGRVTVVRSNLADRYPADADRDARLIEHHKRTFGILAGPELRNRLLGA